MKYTVIGDCFIGSTLYRSGEVIDLGDGKPPHHYLVPCEEYQPPVDTPDVEKPARNPPEYLGNEDAATLAKKFKLDELRRIYRNVVGRAPAGTMKEAKMCYDIAKAQHLY